MPQEREPQLARELQRMEQEYEPLLPVERRLIRWSVLLGIVLLALFVLLSELFL